MNNKNLPTKEKVEEIDNMYSTPFHLYDEKGIRENARNLKSSFSWNKGFKEYFAVKATPNPYIMKVLKEEGFGFDCSSIAELVLCEKLGVSGENIMFTSNNTTSEAFEKANELGAIINLDDITHIETLESSVGVPELICFRYNPGPTREGNEIIGDPKEAKYGLTDQQLIEAYTIMKEKGVKRFGLHTMVASNELNPEFFIETAKMLLEKVDEIEEKVGIKIEFVNMGGGIGIPYKPEDKPVDVNYVGEEVRKLFEERDLALLMEMGRMITGPYGYLITKAINRKNTYKNFIGVDASMSSLMRPGMYGAYHHITILGKENSEESYTYDVVGSLCENIDKFAVDRKLPKIETGDYLAIHDSGAHGLAMAFQYNGNLRPREILLHEDGSFSQIRRPETIEDYFITLDFSNL